MNNQLLNLLEEHRDRRVRVILCTLCELILPILIQPAEELLTVFVPEGEGG